MVREERDVVMVTDEIWAVCHSERAMVILFGLPAVFSFVDLLVEALMVEANVGHEIALDVLCAGYFHDFARCVHPSLVALDCCFP
jgi:hypothetical protein